MEKCLNCGQDVPLIDIRGHMDICKRYLQIPKYCTITYSTLLYLFIICRQEETIEIHDDSPWNSDLDDHDLPHFDVSGNSAVSV